ncbi:MAG: hypothetical protein K940chlam8_00867 [Chlamydiae bacterium]|nr:hypothetical protein [Chlamydiota bacterium]
MAKRKANKNTTKKVAKKKTTLKKTKRAKGGSMHASDSTAIITVIQPTETMAGSVNIFIPAQERRFADSVEMYEPIVRGIPGSTAAEGEAPG